jgi:hypothetical protein
LNPTSGTVGAVQTSNRPGRFSNGRSGLKLDRGPLLDGWCGSKPDWAVGPGQDRLDIFKNTAGVVWWGRLTLSRIRSWTGPWAPVELQTGPVFRRYGVELLDLNGNWAPEKKLEAAVHSSRVKLRGSKTITAKFQTRPTRRWTATFEMRPVSFRTCPPAAFKKNPPRPGRLPNPTKERCGPV